MTGGHSSRSPTSVRSSRVLPWPRSPSSTTSCPAISARSSWGMTVSSKPCSPGQGSRPSRKAASRLSRSSVRRVFWTWPDARSCPTVPMVGWVLGRSEGAEGTSSTLLTPAQQLDCASAWLAYGRAMLGTVCPCGSGERDDVCCGRLHRGEAEAATAEELMRSRYSGYAVGDLDHVFRTWHPRTRPVTIEPDPTL